MHYFMKQKNLEIQQMVAGQPGKIIDPFMGTFYVGLER